ncbi:MULTISPECIES: hypothetical protein [Microbacterium]|uniref:hypothetical protein n=1 Tax=Microbacterium TaxID=33882 RepID=UPI002783137C|nr:MULTISPECIES: hypothetical protein [Microbacterium]MDQ1083880.1 hypothetical protein [Microbacterium sp. SORGH_AS_0344]MDQ1170840.1 hypothetical protein [Microbacterium proteolyticum]
MRTRRLVPIAALVALGIAGGAGGLVALSSSPLVSVAASAPASAPLFPGAPGLSPARAVPAAGLSADGDVDGDTIADAIERVVCGSATCATGTEDTDGDGISDGVEVRACGSVGCADASADADGDGIPDFVERLVCGSDTCTAGREDADGDGVPDWVEQIICGTAICATGVEDLDGDGVADAVSLQAYAVYRQALAITGRSYDGLTWVVFAGVALLLVGAAALAARSLRRAANAAVDMTGVLS